MDNRKKKYRKLAVKVFIISLFAVLLGSCADGGEAQSAGGMSAGAPVLQDCELRGECTGGERNQYITADLKFDKKISYDDKLAEQIRVVIGGQRVKTDKISISQPEDDVLQIKINVVQVNDGRMELTNAPGYGTLTALTDESGNNCVSSLEVKKLIPSGAKISCVQSGSAASVYQVDSVVTHRSIIWLKLYDGETEVVPDDTDTTDVMENASAVHQHEFLWVTPESTAADMAETVNRFYSSECIASADGNRLTVQRKNAAVQEGAAEAEPPVRGELRLQIYEG